MCVSPAVQARITQAGASVGRLATRCSDWATVQDSACSTSMHPSPPSCRALMAPNVGRMSSSHVSRTPKWRMCRVQQPARGRSVKVERGGHQRRGVRSLRRQRVERGAGRTSRWNAFTDEVVHDFEDCDVGTAVEPMLPGTMPGRTDAVTLSPTAQRRRRDAESFGHRSNCVVRRRRVGHHLMAASTATDDWFMNCALCAPRCVRRRRPGSAVWPSPRTARRRVVPAMSLTLIFES